MTKHRRRRSGRSRRRLTTSLAILKATALGSLLAIVVVGGLHGPGTTASSRGDSATEASDAYGRVAARAANGQRCSSDGVAGSSSGSALIRTEGGHVRAVSFEAGWDVLNGKRPGSLIAICVD